MKSLSVICSYLIHKCSRHKRSVRSETNLILNIPFFVFSFFRSIPTTRTTDVKTQFVETVRFFHPTSARERSVTRYDKRAPDLDRFSTYSLFGPLCCVSFLKLCLQPGARLHAQIRDYRIAGSKQYRL